jgi:hypothetical protein
MGLMDRLKRLAAKAEQRDENLTLLHEQVMPNTLALCRQTAAALRFLGEYRELPGFADVLSRYRSHPSLLELRDALNEFSEALEPPPELPPSDVSLN